MRILTSPWWRAPLQLLRRPGVALSLVAATFVAVLPAAAAPLFLGTAQSATVDAQVADACPNVSGVTVTDYVYPTDVQSAAIGFSSAQVLARARRVTRTMASVPNIGPAITTVYQSKLPVQGLPKAHPEKHPWMVSLLSRDNFQDHIQILAKADSPGQNGVWVPDDIAAAWQVSAGDTISIGSDAPLTLTVAGIYRTMVVGHVDRYWCSTRAIFQGNILADEGPPALLLCDIDTVLRVQSHTHTLATITFESALKNPAPPPELAHATTTTLIKRTPEMIADFRSADSRSETEPMTIESRLGLFMTRAALVGHTLSAPIYAVSAAGVLVGLLVLGAATVLWARRREHELMVLAVRGAAPIALGGKAVLEAVPAILLGGALGAVAARWLVVAVGPAGSLSGPAQMLGLCLTAGVVVAATLVVLVVATGRARKLTDTTPHLHRTHRVAAVPWELLTFALAAVLWQQMSGDLVAGDGGLAVGGTVVSLPARTLVIPIMLIMATSVLSARLVAGWLRWRGLKRVPRGHARYLARRRLGREPVVAGLLLAIAAIPAAVAGFAAIAAGSVQRTIDAKALGAVGTDMVVLTSTFGAVPADIASIGPATSVLRTDSITIGEHQASLLAVDPEQFKNVATIGTELAGSAFDRTLDRMATESESSATITVLASSQIPAGPADLVSSIKTLHVNVVRVADLPAALNGIPIVIASHAAIGDGLFDASASPQIWVRTSRVDAVQAAALGNKDLGVNGIYVAADLYANTLFEPITYTFEYFVAIALLTGVVVAVGLLLYLESRTVAHRRAYLMLRRMGMRPRTHRTALLLELCAALGLGLLVAGGTVFAIGLALRDSFDVYPAKAPGTILTISLPTVAVIVGTVLVTAVGAALFGHARIARANPAEVLRDAV